MNQCLMCTMVDHENEQIQGFCINENCQQNPQFCFECLKDRHKIHLEDCKNYKQYENILSLQLKQQDKELEELDKLYDYIRKDYEFHHKILRGEITLLQKSLDYLIRGQYYEALQIKTSSNFNQRYFREKSQSHTLFIAFSQALERVLKGINQPIIRQEVNQQPQQQINDKVYAEQLFKQAQILFDEQNFADALNLFNESIKYNSNQDYVYGWKGRALIKLGQYQEARQICDQAIKINPYNDLVQSTKAGALYSLGCYDEALICCDQAIKINPLNDVAYAIKGLTLGCLNRYQEELTYYDKAIEINRNNEIAYINKGSALNRLKHYQEAIKCCNQVLEINPQLHQAYSIKGIALLELKKYKEAVKCYEKAYQISKKVEYLVAKADTLLESGEKQKSKQLFIEAKKKGYQDTQYLEMKIRQL